MTQIEYNLKERKSIKWIVFGLALSILLVVSSILLLLYPFASKEKGEYFNGTRPILFKGKQRGNAYFVGDTIYIPVKFVKDFLDESLLFDKKSNSIIITTKNKVVQMPSESLTLYINAKPVKLHIPAIQNSDGELFISIDTLLNYYPIQYQKLSGTNAIWIHQSGDKMVYGLIPNKKVDQEKLRLRTEPRLQSPYVSKVKKGEHVLIESETKGYYYIRKENGIAGYLQKDLVQRKEKKQILIKQEEKLVKLPKMKGPIQLTWEAVYNRNPDPKYLPEMPGVNVVSPTWFKLENKEGSIMNLGSEEYVHWAHKNSYQIWGLFSNAFDPELTHFAFKDYETRQKLIRQLLHYSKMYQLNGINFDIENVKIEDGPLITQFVRESTPLFHQAGLTVSMDITFISSSENWSMFYEREKLAQLVDYLIVMAYDEHWGSSPVAGSVASLPWVEENIQKLIEIVPSKKLVLGVPLYTRLWKEETVSGGAIKVSSKALSMSQAKNWLATKSIKPKYDRTTGQNYAELMVNPKTTYKVWLEDELSLAKRAQLVEKYQLAGLASWSRFFADDSAWIALHSFAEKYTDAEQKR